MYRLTDRLVGELVHLSEISLLIRGSAAWFLGCSLLMINSYCLLGIRCCPLSSVNNVITMYFLTYNTDDLLLSFVLTNSWTVSPIRLNHAIVVYITADASSSCTFVPDVERAHRDPWM